LVVLATACTGSDSTDPVDTDDAITDTDADTDTDDTDSETDTDDTDTNDTDSPLGDGFYATVTLNGETFDANCPDIEQPFGTLPNIINFYAGDDLNIGCGVDHVNGFIGRSVFLLFDDREQLVTGPLDTSSAGGMRLSVSNSAGEQARTDADHTQSFTLTGTYDAATRRATGTFDAVWGPTTEAFQFEGSASGTFDLILVDEP
jgi:hypothetical protein